MILKIYSLKNWRKFDVFKYKRCLIQQKLNHHFGLKKNANFTPKIGKQPPKIVILK
jgi:hypothetical protein